MNNVVPPSRAPSAQSGTKSSGGVANRARSFLRTDLDRLSDIKALSWLSSEELELLASALEFNEIKSSEILFHGGTVSSKAQILLKGIARITCQSPRCKRITIALLGAGPIPELPAGSRFDFRCEAYDKCRIGTVSWTDFADIVAYASKFAFEEFHRNDSQQCFKMLLRSSTLMGLNLHDRTAITMLELAMNFGIKESRGVLLTEQFSHQQIADLVGASRPRISEHLAELEREGLIIRQDRHFIVNEKIEDLIRVPATKETFSPREDESLTIDPVE